VLGAGTWESGIDRAKAATESEGSAVERLLDESPDATAATGHPPPESLPRPPHRAGTAAQNIRPVDAVQTSGSGGLQREAECRMKDWRRPGARSRNSEEEQASKNGLADIGWTKIDAVVKGRGRPEVLTDSRSRQITWFSILNCRPIDLLDYPPQSFRPPFLIV
jgi:hypothetical protein